MLAGDEGGEAQPAGTAKTRFDGVSYIDPRHAGMGERTIRLIDPDDTFPTDTDQLEKNRAAYDAFRISLGVPDTDRDLIADKSMPLESGFDELHGVDFEKGCYVGQEVTARMKHKTELRKGLARVVLDGPAEAGTDINMGGKVIGRLHTVSGDQAMAYLRFDQAGDGMLAGKAGVRIDSAEA